MKNILKITMLFCMASQFVGVAYGQSAVPPAVRNVDPNGVDFVTNEPYFSMPSISSAGIARIGSNKNPPFEDNFMSAILKDAGVTVGGSLFQPRWENNATGTINWQEINHGNILNHDGSALSCTLAECRLTMKDGTVAVYDTSMVSDPQGRRPGIMGMMTKLLKPYGEVLNFYYKVKFLSYPRTVIGVDQYGTERYQYHEVNMCQLQTVTSSLGWMVKYELEERSEEFPNVNWWSPKKIYIVNRSEDYCAQNEEICTGVNASKRPTLNIFNKYNYSDSAGDAYGRYDSVSMEKSSGLRKSYDYLGRLLSVKVGSRQWNYTYSWDKDNHTPPYIVTVTDPAGKKYSMKALYGEAVFSASGCGDCGFVDSSYAYGTFTSEAQGTAGFGAFMPATITGGFSIYLAYVNLGPISEFTNELGLTTKYTYADNFVTKSKPIYQVISPEATYNGTALTGGYTQYGYDNRQNITSVTVVPKGGGTALVTDYEYDDCSDANFKYCNKPKKVTDPKRNFTEYTYSADHGGVLTETGPANNAGVRSQIRYSYTAFYAKIKAADGQLVNAEAPIYRLTKTSSCTVAVSNNPSSCVGTANEAIKEMAYNHNNLLLTSETVRAGDNSVSATTSYSYDYVGNVVSVNGPRTDVDDISYTTYDVRRRKVYEISPDPDGAGPLKRSIVKHFYDNDDREYRTETGAGAGIVFDGTVPVSVSDFVWSTARVMTYDNATGDLAKTDVVVP